MNATTWHGGRLSVLLPAAACRWRSDSLPIILTGRVSRLPRYSPRLPDVLPVALRFLRLAVAYSVDFASAAGCQVANLGLVSVESWIMYDCVQTDKQVAGSSIMAWIAVTPPNTRISHRVALWVTPGRTLSPGVGGVGRRSCRLDTGSMAARISLAKGYWWRSCWPAYHGHGSARNRYPPIVSSRIISVGRDWAVAGLHGVGPVMSGLTRIPINAFLSIQLFPVPSGMSRSATVGAFPLRFVRLWWRMAEGPHFGPECKRSKRRGQEGQAWPYNHLAPPLHSYHDAAVDNRQQITSRSRRAE